MWLILRQMIQKILSRKFQNNHISEKSATADLIKEKKSQKNKDNTMTDGRRRRRRTTDGNSIREQQHNRQAST